MRALARGLVLATLVASPVLAGVGVALTPAPARAEAQVLDRIVAVVNDDIILESDLALWMMYDERIALELSQMKNPSEEQLLRKLEELEPAALDELIARKLMLAQAPNFQVTATSEEVDAYLQNLARNAGLGGVPDLKRAVEDSMRYGTWAQYKHKLYEDVILFKLEAMLVNVAVSDQQVLDRYRELSKSEEAKMEVIRLVFRGSEDAAEQDQVFKRAKAVVRRLHGGEEPEALAAELGQEAQSEIVTRRSVSRPIGKRLFAADAGDVVGPLQSGQGFVVFVVEEVITSDILGFEEAKEDLRAKLLDEAREKALGELREQLRGRAHVDIRL